MTTVYYRTADGSLGYVSGDDVETPDGATTLTAEEYGAEVESIDTARKADLDDAAKASAVARKKAFRELTQLGLSVESAKLILGID